MAVDVKSNFYRGERANSGMLFVFFFSSRRRHTRLQGDWSSDVCSSDLVGAGGLTKPHAFVVAQERREGLAEELQAFVRERLEAYKAPREVIFLDALPRTHLGKVDRARLRRP